MCALIGMTLTHADYYIQFEDIGFFLDTNTSSIISSLILLLFTRQILQRQYPRKSPQNKLNPNKTTQNMI